MTEKYLKYADLLINGCLKVEEDQPLFIAAPIEVIDFIRILSKVAYKKGVSEIYYDFDDEILRYNALNSLDKKKLKNTKFFNKKIYDEYAKKGAAFLMLCADQSDIMKDIDADKINFIGEISITTRPLYKKRQLNGEVKWCIACVATNTWAKKVLPESLNPKEELWNLIFKMCLVDKENPIKEWNNKIEKNALIASKLNDLNIKKLHYKNSLGTDLTIGLNQNIWCLGGENDQIVNMPTEEIFTTPDMYTAEGIVYSSKPLIYSNTLIENFWLKFKKGKVIDYDAKTGKETLGSILKIKGGNYIGEIALVDTTTPIAKSNILFYDTLYDENASCHIALGQGFLECIKGKKLEDCNANDSDTHVDFMIGTDDLEIVAETDNGKITIMKDGKIVIEK